MEKAHIDDTTWREKSKRAVQIFSLMQKDLEDRIADLCDNIDSVQKKISELTNALTIVNNKRDMNLSLFSPYDNTPEIMEDKNIRKELDELVNDLPVLVQEFNDLKEKSSQYQLIYECLVKLELNYSGETENLHIDDLQKLEVTSNQILDKENKEWVGIKILQTQELERQRIARDLHDSTIQSLTSLVHKTELSIKLLDLDTIRARLEMATMIESIKTIINNMRDVIYDLRPMSIQDLGLNSTIERFISNYKEQNNIQVLFKAGEENKCVLPVVSLTLYRIVQEACNNIAKYANATTCMIELEYLDQEIKLTVEDNGIGFEQNMIGAKKGNEKSGFGLSIMKERALLLSGSFEITTHKNAGTKITVIIPYHEYKEES